MGRVHQGVRRRDDHGVPPFRAGLVHGLPGDDPQTARRGGPEGARALERARGVPRFETVRRRGARAGRDAPRRLLARPGVGSDRGLERGGVDTSGLAQVPAGAPRVRRRHAHEGEPAPLHAQPDAHGGVAPGRVALRGRHQPRGGARLLRRRQGPAVPGADQGARRRRGVLRHAGDVRGGLQADVQQLPPVQRPGHGVLQVRRPPGGVFRGEGAGGHLVETRARRTRREGMTKTK